MLVLLDETPLSLATHPNSKKSKPILEWIEELINSNASVQVPEIADYELRRELIRSGKTRSIARLEQFELDLGFVPLNTDAIRAACKFWADVRNIGQGGASDISLDGDALLAGQAFIEQQRLMSRVVIATNNLKHFKHFPVEAKKWQDVKI